METQNCPYCGEQILITAKKCKHCGEWLEESNKRKGTDWNERGSSDARSVTKGFKQKEFDDNAMGCGTGIILVVAIGIGVYTSSWVIGLILFCLGGWLLTKSYYKE